MRTGVQKSGQILEKNFFTKFFFNYDLRKIRKWLIKKISIGCDTRHIAQTKEEKKGFQKVKKSGGGTGSNFTLKILANFQILKKI